MRVRTGMGALLLAGAALAGCNSAESADGPAAGAGGGGPPAMPVETRTAWVDTVVDAIRATGQIEPMQSIQLTPEVDGRITAILMREGAEVRRGAPLFRIDDAEMRQQLIRAEAERDLARQALERTKGLIAQKAASQADLEQAEATARSTAASYELLRLQVERSTVRAPFSGVLGSRSVSLGDYVTSSTPLVSLQTVNPQRATFQVPERYAEALRRGQRVRFTVAALPEREFVGVVDFVDPVVQLPARSITVKAEVPNPDRQLQGGMFIEAALATETRPGAVMIPEEAVLPLQGSNYVWVVQENGTVTRRETTLGIRRPGEVEVRAGIAAGEQVVV
ncbi:MAG: efflux RND transporter periplasmic adaptor subunit, partial [Gemmatimonadota bacterium]|nr:efflux RND transporter periplasmic adaptor subunit [Gemmatimonadota bacterium]